MRTMNEDEAKAALLAAEPATIDGKEVESTEIGTIDFLYNGQHIQMAGTRYVTFKDGTKVEFPLTYDCLVATLARVPEQFGPPEPTPDA
jgi:hypothetical protein